MISPAVLVLVAMATATSARNLLVDQVQNIAGSLPNRLLTSAEKERLSTDSEPGVYMPGRSNICDALCPKWCQKINGTTTDRTNCHYLCGNICFDKTTSVNPFVGNARYEVVPSDFEFSRYDLNHDKRISREEFARTEHVTLDETNDLFMFADMNRDGYIDTQEFNGGPLVFTVQMAAELSAMAMSDKKSTTQGRPASQARPATQIRPATQARPFSQRRPATQGRPATQARQSTQIRPATQGRPATQIRQTTQIRPATQGRPATQRRPASQARPASQTRPASQGRPATQTRPVNQRRPAIQGRPATQARPATRRQTATRGLPARMRGLPAIRGLPTK